MAAGDLHSGALERRILGIEQRDDLVDGELEAHPVERDETQPPRLGRSAREPLEGFTGVADIDERVAERVVEVIIGACFHGLEN